MTTEYPRIAIAVPSGDMLHADFAMSLASLCYGCASLDIVVFNTKSSIVAQARNKGVEMAQQAAVDYIWFVDSDMTFPQTALLRLLIHQKDIVGATYVKRVPPFPLLGTPLDPQPDDHDAGLIEMTRIPTGCLLIRMSVFERLTKPYFYFGVDKETGAILGEDYLFCDRVREQGLRIWCDTALSQELGHIGQTIHHSADVPVGLGKKA